MRTSEKRERWQGLAAGVALALTASGAAGAEPGTTEERTLRSSALEEVVVTGTKREQGAQDIPIAVTAISGEQLERTFRNDILAVAELSPGVTLGTLPGFRALTGGIRGTGQNSILVTQDSSVVILLDEFALSNVQAQFVEMFDVEQIEVYRGPQGTLFGKSATGGAISITTKRPEMNEFGGTIESQYGQFTGGDVDADIFKLKGALNIPVIDDQLAIRLTGIYDFDDGYYENAKDTATFPNFVPLYGALDPALAVNPPLPPELNTRTQGSNENINGTDIFAGTAKVLWQPTQNYEAYLKYEILRDESDTVPGVHETPAGEGFLMPLLGFPGIQEAGHDETFVTGVTNQCVEGNPEGLCLQAGQRVDVDGIHLHQRLDVDQLTFRLLSGYRRQEEILPNTYVGEAFTSLFDASRNSVKENTQVEFRMNTNFAGPFNFVAGAAYEDSSVDFQAYSTVGLSGLLPGPLGGVDEDRNDGIPAPLFDDRGFLNLDLDFLTDPAMTRSRQERESWAVYADGSFEFTPRLSLDGGIRYTKDKKDFLRQANPGGPCTALTPAKDQLLVDGVCLDARSNAVSRVGPDFTAAQLSAFNIPLPRSAFGISDEFSDDWSEVTWRAALNYDFTDSAMAYLSYATGFIPGGFTETCSSPATCVPFDSETNSNVEVGMKAQFLDNTVRTNVAVYYTVYEDLIRSQVLPFTNAFGVTTQETVNVNAGESEAKGVEAELTWLPLDNLVLGLNLTYLDHEYEEFELDRDGDGVLEDLSDLDIPFSPEWKVGGSVTYDQFLGNGRGSLTYNASFNYQSATETLVFEPTLTEMQARTLVDANVTWRSASEKYRVALWGKNLLDQENRLSGNSVAGLWNFTSYGRPQSIGVEVGVQF